MIAELWNYPAIVDLAYALVSLVVVWLVRTVAKLQNRVTRLEALLEPRDERRRRYD